MAGDHGKFVWYELMTGDLKAAGAFYAKIFGWRMEGEGYVHINVGDRAIGGMMEMPAELRGMGVHPHWGGYIAVDDVDAHARKAEAAGGILHKAPEDIPMVGRFAVIADPAGATFMIFKDTAHTPAPPRPPESTQGHIGWHELNGGDPAKSFEFYAGLFGWTKADAMDMGPDMGLYQMFSIDGVPFGGMMKKAPDMPVAAWLYYVHVDDIDAAAKRVTDNGGTILFGPHEVPGGQWVVQALDPQRAAFAMVGPRKK